MTELAATFLEPHLREAFHDTSAAEDLSPEDRARLEARFARTFAAFLERGFDVVFREEILGGKGGRGGEEEKAQEVEEKEKLNATVTEEDLLELDLALQGAATRRRVYPPRLSLYLDKILQHRTEESASVRTDLGTRPPLEEGNDIFPDREDLLTPSAGSEDEALLADSKTQVERVKRIVSSAKILLANCSGDESV